MTIGKVAGHTFDSLDWCDCGRRWLDLQHVDYECVGMGGIAHYGKLDINEYYQIEAERRRRDALLEEVMSETWT